MSIYEVVEQFGLKVEEVQSGVYEVINPDVFINYKGLQYFIGRCSMVTSDSCKSFTDGYGVTHTFRKIYYIFIYGVTNDVISYYEQCAKDMHNNDILYSAYCGEQSYYTGKHIDTIYNKEEIIWEQQMH